MYPCEGGCGALIDHGWNRRFCADCKRTRDYMKAWRARHLMTRREEAAGVEELRAARATTDYSLRLLRAMLDSYFKG